MEINHSVNEQLNLIASQVRLLAGLMLAGSNLNEEESDAFAMMLKDVAGRLDRLTGENQPLPLLREWGQESQHS